VFKDRAVRSELTNCLGAAFASKQKLLQLAMLAARLIIGQENLGRADQLRSSLILHKISMMNIHHH